MLKRGRSAARAAAVTARLRELGYPAPRYVRVEAEWALQEELPGKPLEPWRRLPEEIAAQLLSLHELHAEPFPVATPGSWRRVVASSVLSGARSYLRLATLRDHSDASRELLARCQDCVRRFAERVPEADAIVHWDFTPDTVLLEEALAGLDPGLRAVYQAHLCVRQAEWSLRRHDAATGERMLAYALEVASGFPSA